MPRLWPPHRILPENPISWHWPPRSFHPNLDVTSIDQINRVTEIHQPDGKKWLCCTSRERRPTVVVNGHLALGPSLPGIICNDLANTYFWCRRHDGRKIGNEDDRWYLMEDNPRRELRRQPPNLLPYRVLKGFQWYIECTLSSDIARKVYASTGNGNNRALFPKVQAAVELYLTTGEQPYMDSPFWQQRAHHQADRLHRLVHGTWENSLHKMKNKKAKAFHLLSAKALTDMNKSWTSKCRRLYGIPTVHISGAGWDIQFSASALLPDNRLSGNIPESTGIQCPSTSFSMPPAPTRLPSPGCHAQSATVGYGLNRADWSYIPVESFPVQLLSVPTSRNSWRSCSSGSKLNMCWRRFIPLYVPGTCRTASPVKQ